VRSESLSALRLRYVDLVVSVEVAVEICSSSAYFRKTNSPTPGFNKMALLRTQLYGTSE
jgi:hypothetical protein